VRAVKSTSTVPAFSESQGALALLFRAARAQGADPETKRTARHTVARRFGAFLGGLVSGAELSRLTLVSETKAHEYLDPRAAKAGLRATELPMLDPPRFRAVMAWAIETHRAIWGDEGAGLTREQLAMVACAAMSDAENDIARSMFGDLRIDSEEARAMIPKLLHAYRKIRALLVALGIDPDAGSEP
jgi:hypothetical protein